MSVPSSALAAALLILAIPCAAGAQLISPGKLAAPHQSWEGVRQCTSCHELGSRGVSAARCLACHEPLEHRMRAREGYHATVGDRACGECHKEHFGRDFALVRLDTVSFDHGAAGYPLEAGHAGVACRDCHRPERITDAGILAWGREHGSLDHTLLGLATGCAGCHQDADPHGGQFVDRSCADCHTATSWEDVPRFDHARTRYPLTGRHAGVSCEGCHAGDRSAATSRMRWTAIAFSTCASCHTDPHAGTMPGACASCHDTRGWNRVDQPAVERRFDHDVTGFPLTGQHAVAGCAACHGRSRSRSPQITLRFVRGTEARAYPRPLAGTCAACHVDWHERAFAASPSAGECEACHSERGWSPARFDIARHETTSFALTGAHLVTPCNACHASADSDAKPGFRFADLSCQACHRDDDPHGERYAGTPCADCHITRRFDAIAFDHAAARPESCAGCHAADDPHGDQFAARSCDGCHVTATFRIAAFDHGPTRFPLEGEHRTVPCTRCHITETPGGSAPLVRWRPVARDCAACHGAPA